MPKNRRIVLAHRPAGLPSEADFRMVEEDVPTPADGECLVQGVYLSVDPYMRGRMRDRPSYAPPLGIGELMTGGVVGRVLESHSDKVPAGAIVQGDLGWQEYAVAAPDALRIVDPGLAPISTALGVLGMPGLTAYFGLFDVCKPRAGETLLVSGAAGAVGSIVGQLARIGGCRVVGVTGSDQKVGYLAGELGFDAAFNYKSEADYGGAIERLCPGGVDLYFDNVGGSLTDAVAPRLNVHARIALCGQISQYNLSEPERGPRWLFHLIIKRAKIEGFLVFDYADRYDEALTKLGGWVRAGRLQWRETISEGIESAPRAFIGMLTGENIGKQLVRLAAES